MLISDPNNIIEACAKVAEAWAPFVEAQHAAGECDHDEMRTSRATALTIARKIRELKS